MHFISGLPRSGSSLLASLLRQNPACHAGIMSPVGRVVTDMLHSMGPSNEAHGFITDKQRLAMVEAVVDAYYEDVLDKIVFDTNRRWCSNVSLLTALYPTCYIICCVRPPAHIVDSFERLYQAHPLTLSNIIGASNTNVYGRVPIYLGPQGVVGYAYNALREAFYGPLRPRLLLIEYSDLAQCPQRVMDGLTDTLGLPAFEYDFQHVQPLPGAAEFDRSIGAPGLHDLKAEVLYTPCNSILPPDLYRAMPPAFWRANTTVTNPR